MASSFFVRSKLPVFDYPPLKLPLEGKLGGCGAGTEMPASSQSGDSYGQ